eukprot:TRINITY_DN4427_c0_g1_i2.p1 TRINITY_DN4427_c0_g1~~TRINITY_DN4427_c0_g1_i2.p1  ORF type:complete len:860 (-),score=230.35 TRINITY_DN4427_c0_g1_i2:72-2651(-)
MGGGAWPFLVRGVICLLNCDNERDLNLLNSGRNVANKGEVAQHLDHQERDSFLSILSLIIFGGEAFSQRLLLKLHALLDPNVKILNAYGPSEVAIMSTTFNASKSEYNNNNHYNNSSIVPVGSAIGNRQLYIADQDLKLVPIGVFGELYIGGIGVARGYLNRDELTRERFTSNPFTTQNDIVYKTGDLCRWLENGCVEFKARVDEQVKINGIRIEVGEIENVLMLYEEVYKAAVVIVTKNKTSEEEEEKDKKLVAFVVLKEEFKMKSGQNLEMRNFMRSNLPEGMVPKEYIILNHLPLSPNGKTDYKQLTSIYLTNNNKIIPMNTLVKKEEEKKEREESWKSVEDIWRGVLNLGEDKGKIENEDSFFELGGGSLSAVRVIMKLNQKYKGYNFNIKLLFQFPAFKLFCEKVARILNKEPNQPHDDDNNKIDFIKEITKLDNEELNNSNNSNPSDSEQELLLNSLNLSNSQHIFLTGAAGYLGSFLLEQLLILHPDSIIFCLIRAKNIHAAKNRIIDSLEHYKIYNPSHSSRIIPILGDLSLPFFHCSQSTFEFLLTHTSTVYHSGSAVNFVQTYSQLYSTNVYGTFQILKFCSYNSHPKLLHHISTIGVYSFVHRLDKARQILNEQDDLKTRENVEALELDIGYIQSKWVAENMVQNWMRSNSVRAIIYRPGFILCHSKTGAASPTCFWSRILKDAYILGSYPKLTNLKEEFITIDFTVGAIIEIGKKQEWSEGKVFNIAPGRDDNITFGDMFEMVKEAGMQLAEVELFDWRAELESYLKEMERRGEEEKKEEEGAGIGSLLGLFRDEVWKGETLFEVYQNNLEVGVRNTEEALRGSGVKWGRITTEMMEKYLEFMKLEI